LQDCKAVQNIKESGEVIVFTFDPSQQPEQPPAGVYFELAEAPF
jgi:hypothetical protein